MITFPQNPNVVGMGEIAGLDDGILKGAPRLELDAADTFGPEEHGVDGEGVLAIQRLEKPRPHLVSTLAMRTPSEAKVPDTKWY